MLYIIISFLSGIIAVIIYLVFLSKIVKKYLKPNKKIYEVIFRLDYYNPGSLFNPSKGQLIKSQPITVRIKAVDEQEALLLLEEIIKKETKGELVKIKEVGHDQEHNNSNERNKPQDFAVYTRTHNNNTAYDKTRHNRNKSQRS